MRAGRCGRGRLCHFEADGVAVASRPRVTDPGYRACFPAEEPLGSNKKQRPARLVTRSSAGGSTFNFQRRAGRLGSPVTSLHISCVEREGDGPGVVWSFKGVAVVSRPRVTDPGYRARFRRRSRWALTRNNVPPASLRAALRAGQRSTFNVQRRAGQLGSPVTSLHLSCVERDGDRPGVVWSSAEWWSSRVPGSQTRATARVSCGNVAAASRR